MSSEERTTLFVDVIVPLPVPGLFTYRVPHSMNDAVAVGKRVIVQFGRKKVLSALVRRIHTIIPSDYTPKYLLEVLDPSPILHEAQIKFWEWIAHYYMCNLGEVMAAALPSALKLESESKVALHPEFVQDSQLLSDNEFLVTEALSIQPQLSIEEVSKIVGFSKVMPLLRTMIEKKYLVMQEELEEQYKPKKEKYVKLADTYCSEEQLKILMDSLSKRAYKQMEMLMVYVRETRVPDEVAREMQASELLRRSDASVGQLKAMIDKGIFTSGTKVVSRLSHYLATADAGDIQLTSHQQQAYDTIQKAFEQKEVVLLHGVTSSGKTEIYIKLIAEALKNNQQVLYLLPEIALTTQIIDRLKTYFGNKVGVYHSRYNAGQKVEVWNAVLKPSAGDNSHQVIIGPRSALFLPFSQPSLIIVDEEHDSSYKQHDPAPRYHARDSAIVMASLFNARVLLGSATPSYETYFNVQLKRYGLAQLTERYGGIELPLIQLVNLREETRRKTMQSHFSSVLMKELKQAVEKKEQVILFQNRRGFSLRLECDDCNWVPQCKNCDVSLVYHKKQNLLRCHYCGYGTAVPSHCPKCNSSSVRMHGFGTEKVEEELGLMVPGLRIARLDLDTTRSKHSFQLIFDSFAQGKTDVLTGTQMVTKGLDFEKVSMVGILNADNILSYPDFRAYERSFQLMAQVSGRAGRRGKQGKVLIQTYQPSKDIFQYVLRNAYEQLYENQLINRKKFHYPPYFRLILVRLMHRDSHTLNVAAHEFSLMLRQAITSDILGPEFPMVSKIRNMYIKQIIIKFPRSVKSQQLKEKLSETIRLFHGHLEFKSVKIQLDVDPQ